MTMVSGAAAAEREQARKQNGRFGEQNRPDPGGDVLVDVERLRAELDADIRRLIDEVYGGSAGAFVHDIATDLGVAVAYQDREMFEGGFRKLTDDEWVKVQPHLRDFDEWMDNSGAAESIAYWRDRVLRHAGVIVDDCEVCGDPAGTDFDNYCNGCGDLVAAHNDGEHREALHLSCPECIPF